MLHERNRPFILEMPDGRFTGNSETLYGNRELPIWDVMDDVNLNLMYNRGVVLSAQTGSGKSTQVPQAIYHELLEQDDNKQIIVVQNRVAVAMELADRVSSEMNTQVGDIVGYSTGPYKMQNPSNRIVFMTNGVFAHMIRNNPALANVHTVIFDEFDERELRMDIGASLVAKAREEGSETKMILMSATLDADEVSQFYGDLPIVKSEGRQYPIDYHFAENSINDFEKPSEAAKKAAEVHISGEDGDILIFMPGKREIQQVVDAFRRKNLDGVSIFPLHSEISAEDRKHIFGKIIGRKIIVSTNIAERGLTIDGVRHVIDSGLARMIDYDPRSDATKLLLGECAKDVIRQRAGRGGRTSLGHYYPLFTQDEYLKRPDATKPEIQRSTLRDVVLQIKAMGYSREQDPLRIMDTPDKVNWQTAKNQLKQLGALDLLDDTKLSEFGQRMADLPCDSRDAAMLLHAAEGEYLNEMIRIVSIRMSRRLFYRPMDSRNEADNAHRSFLNSANSDLINLLKVIQNAEQREYEYKWAKSNFISYPALQEIRVNIRKMRQSMRAFVRNEDSSEMNEPQLCQIIAKGFPDKVYDHEYGRYYISRETQNRVMLGRESSVRNAKVLVANEIIDTGRGEFISVATKLE